MYGCFNKGHARTWFLVLMNNALPEEIELHIKPFADIWDFPKS
jgi:hypothetical protein